MDIDAVKAALSGAMAAKIDFYERRPGKHQLIVPILHEDGDMVDIYIQSSPLGDGHVRVCDFGLTLMRLSYTLDLTDSRQRVFDSILINSGVQNDGGNLYIDAPMGMLGETALQFAGCAQKVCNMRYWNRESVRSAFYEDLGIYIAEELAEYSPIADRYPLPDYPISVDWTLTCNSRDFYVFGVRGNDKAKSAAIALLEFQKADLIYTSMVVHEDMEELGSKERLYLTRNADNEYPDLSGFKDGAPADIRRLAPTA